MDSISVKVTIKFKGYYLFLYKLSSKVNLDKLAIYFANRYIKSCKFSLGNGKWQKMNLDIEFEELNKG